MKQSVRHQVLEFMKGKDSEWVKPADFIKLHPGIPPQQVHVVFSLLKKRKILKHNARKHTYMYVWDQLSPDNQKPTKPVKPEKPKLDPARENDAKTIQYLIDEQNRLHAELASVDEKYNDALAVVRYLEDKLIKTIQYTAQFED